MKKEELIALNPWVKVAEKMQKCIDTNTWECDGGFVCEDDRSIVEEHNRRCKDDSKFVTEVVPWPFSGNLLNAKVVVLLLNPGYVERINKPTLIDGLDDVQRVFYQGKINDCNFSADKMIESEEEDDERNRYWYQRLSSLWSNDLFEKDNVLKKVAILQSVGYRSTHYAEYRSFGRLPSSKYVYKIIDYLA